MTDSPTPKHVPIESHSGESRHEGAKPCGITARVITGSRLHFGLLDTMAPFGGVGVMVDFPETQLRVSPHGTFSPDTSIAERATQIATRLCQHVGHDHLPACRIHVVTRPPSHCGLGSGTQLSLAIAESLCEFLGVEMDPHVLAVEIAGRGKRSAIGVHGYFAGGLIDERSETPTDLNPMKHRIALPEQWRVIITCPRSHTQPISGKKEAAQFAALTSAGAEAKANLIQILDDEILPAAKAADFSTFANGVHRYNHASGMLFAEVQGGPYHGEAVTRLIDQSIQLGGHGVGQSSWGPGVFAWFESQRQMDQFADLLPDNVKVIAKARPTNRPRKVVVETSN